MPVCSLNQYTREESELISLEVHHERSRGYDNADEDGDDDVDDDDGPGDDDDDDDDADDDRPSAPSVQAGMRHVPRSSGGVRKKKAKSKKVRYFNPEWAQTQPWIRYDPIKEKMSCIICAVHHDRNRSSYRNNAW